MNKFILFFACIFYFGLAVFGQAANNKMLFVIDSIPVFKDPESWNQILKEDIADLNVLINKDSLKLLGWGHLDGITYIFTKEYRNRPDSLKKIPSLKQMVMRDGMWHLNNSIYSGRYIDYYNNGRIQNEGTLLNGKLDGELIVYFKNGNKKSVAHYTDGIVNGLKNEYYKNGALMQTNEFVNGRRTRAGKMYFINGQIQHEIRLKNQTRYDTSVAYYSTGKIRKIKLTKDGIFIPDKKEQDLNYYTNKFYYGLRTGDLKDANRAFFKILQMDSTSIDTYFKGGMLMLKEFRFGEAIAEFDKALQIEPLMRESLVYRGFARIKKYKYAHINALLKDNKEVALTVEDMSSIPKDEQQKICNDLLLADDLDPSDYLVREAVSAALLNYCRNLMGRL